ncbi:hypothetical protein F11_08505 [Rhodospirillum rubrum F11]|nr:tetratricopeptide repeat protein [Rhodospirillum rubrum]AEO48167.1 hypothetical protein F11_08505 [Rhodospirillum rubrum F11]QXG82082.1 tetratricopeptide repeat protein [Rhodospirillum rubrum]
MSETPEIPGSGYRTGEALLRAGDIAGAITAFRGHLAASPDDALGWFALGSALFFAQRWEETRAAYARAAAIDRAYTLGGLLRPGDVETALDPAPFLGQLPEMSMIIPPAHSGPLAVVGCDSAYFLDFGAALALSMDKAAPGWGLHLHLIAPTTPALDLLERLIGGLRAITLSFSLEHLPPALRAPEAQRTYLACLRFMRLPAILDEQQARAGRVPVVVLDADSLMCKPLLGPDDWRPPGPEGGWRAGWDVALKDSGLFPLGPLWRYSASCVGLAPTDEARAFAAHVATLLARQALTVNGLGWMIDQFALAVAIAARQTQSPAFRLGDWPDRLYRLYENPPDAALWSFCSQSKYDDRLYRDMVRLLLAEMG